MKFYLSSYKIGDHPEELKRLLPHTNPRMAYIFNALDSTKNDSEWLAGHIQSDMDGLNVLGIHVEALDLKTYFGEKNHLKSKLREFDGVWISGGSAFVLRQAMRLSGFDEILKELSSSAFLYAGYSAAGCVLSPSLKGYQTVDDSTDMPYEGCTETIWEGLGLLDYTFLPHWNSDHPESADIDKEIEYCKSNAMPFKTLRDGEVIVIE